MAKRGGNQSKYCNSDEPASLDNPSKCTQRALELMWEKSKRRDPLTTKYEAINSLASGQNSISGAETAAALKLLYEVTGDEAFRTAHLVLQSYGFDRGGLKESLKASLRGHLDARPVIRLMLPKMHGWRQRVKSDIQAARLTVAQHGIPGQSFTSVVDEMRKAYVPWKAAVKAKRPGEDFKVGDTGRKLKVCMSNPWLGADNKPMSEIRSVEFDSEGFALAPDDTWWREMIHKGMFHLCGVIDQSQLLEKV